MAKRSYSPVSSPSLPPSYEDAILEDFEKTVSLSFSPDIPGPVQICVLLDMSGSMEKEDIQLSSPQKISRKLAGATLLQALASNPPFLANALEGMGIRPDMVNMSMIGFAATAKKVMSARIVRRCPRCCVYEFDEPTPTIVCTQESPFSSSSEIKVKKCAKCLIPVSDFVCNFHPFFGQEIEPQHLGSNSLQKIIFERALESPVVRNSTNVALGMAVLGMVLTEDGTTVKYQRPIGTEAQGQDAEKEGLVPSSSNHNPVHLTAQRTVLLYIGDDEPNVSCMTPYSAMACHTVFGERTLLPIVTVQVSGGKKWDRQQRMRDFAFNNEIVRLDEDLESTLRQVCDLLVRALRCTQPCTLENPTPDKIMKIKQQDAGNVQVLPGETLTLMIDPLSKEEMEIEWEDCSEGFVHDSMKNLRAEIANAGLRDPYKKRTRV